MRHLTNRFHFSRFFAVSAAALALASSAMGQSAPAVPPNLEVPAGNKAFLKGHAVGTQNYVCLPSGWTFVGPQATLFVTLPWFGGEIRQQIATHFLSANPAENGIARPTWQSSLDTSAVWGKAVANSSDAAYVAPGAIPWLLLQVVGTQQGPAGGNALTPATYIQRLNTSGGVAPTSECSAANIGSVALVPYSADYYFYYKAAR
jgi:hypothetical protein